MNSIITSLMFVGEQARKAEETIKLYTSLFPESEIFYIQRYEAGEHEPVDSTKMAKFTINGIEFMAFDSHLDHQFTFTPSMHCMLSVNQRARLRRLFEP